MTEEIEKKLKTLKKQNIYTEMKFKKDGKKPRLKKDFVDQVDVIISELATLTIKYGHSEKLDFLKNRAWGLIFDGNHVLI